jgi:hypothetical protein
MRYRKNILKDNLKAIFAVLLMLFPAILNGQDKIRIGIHAEPIISWFGTDIDAVKSSGARSGFNFGIAIEKPFSPNYSFSTGLNLISSGGKLTGKDTTILELTNQTSEFLPVDPNKVVVYKIQYLSIPFGLKLKTNQIGYMTFFTDVGLDPKVVVGGKVDIPYLDISNEKAASELKLFNAGYHIKAGIEYGIGGSTAFVFGLGFENNFLDVTKDNSDQPKDKITHRIISFRLGMIF